MPNFKESRILNYTQKQLYQLVLDVEKYPEFVPHCESCKIIERKEKEIITDLSVSFGFISKKYRSSVTYGVKDDQYFVNVKQISGPFKYLETKWCFDKYEENKTRIQFEIDFMFESEIINSLIGSLFEKASKTMVKAFEDRAKEIYGTHHSTKTE